MGRPREFDEMSVVNAARDAFWVNGYAGTSMDSIASAAGLGKGSLYGAFAGKRQLFRRVFDEYCISVVADAQARLTGPDEAALDRLATYLYDTAEASAEPSRRGCLLAKGVAELSEHDPQVAERSRRTLEAIEKLLTDTVTAAQRHGDLHGGDPRLQARMLLAVLRGMEAMGKTGMSADQLKGVAQTALASTKSL